MPPFSSSLVDLFQGIPLSESNDHTFQPLASTWSDPSKGEDMVGVNYHICLEEF